MPLNALSISFAAEQSQSLHFRSQSAAYCSSTATTGSSLIVPNSVMTSPSSASHSLQVESALNC